MEAPEQANPQRPGADWWIQGWEREAVITAVFWGMIQDVLKVDRRDTHTTLNVPKATEL